MKYYVVIEGRIKGIYFTWDDCKKQIDHYKGAKYKSFKYKKDADFYYKNGYQLEVKKENISIFFGGKSNKIKKNKKKITVYTDGDSFMDNNKRYSGYGIYFKNGSKRYINYGTNTNNQCEIQAILSSIELVENKLKNGYLFHIVTDSQYAIQIFNMTNVKYSKRKKSGTLTNKEWVEKAIKYNKIYNLKFTKIKSHTNLQDINSIGNMNADKLAMYGSLVEYYKKDIKKIDLSDIKMPFGKYKNKKLNEINRGYFEWFLEQRIFDIKHGLLYRQIALFCEKN